MISALVLSPSLRAGQTHPRAAEAVARSLNALVRAAVEGILRDVAIAGPAEDDLTVLADHAGCEYIETASAGEGLSRAAALMRSPVAFVLEGGFAPSSGFAEEVGEIPLDPALFRGALLRCAPETFLTRLAPSLARPVGALAGLNEMREAAPRDLADLIRRLKIRRALTVRATRVV
jgi:hypothetical protein